MAKINDLTQGNLGELARQQHRDQYATPLNGSSVGHGGQRFYGTGKLTVENEGLYVTGTASITGSLTVDGTSRFSGQTFIYGPLEVTGSTILDGPTDVGGTFTVTGPTHLNGVTDIGGNTTVTGTLDVTGVTTLDGDTTVNGLFKVTGDSTISGKLDVTGNMASKGTLSIEGVTTLAADLNVTAGGRITVGGMILEPAAGGQINFTGGAISRGAFGMLINDASRVELAAATVRLSGNIVMPNLASTTSAANVYYDPGTGTLYYKP